MTIFVILIVIAVICLVNHLMYVQNASRIEVARANTKADIAPQTASLTLDRVVVKPMKAWQGHDFTAPWREPINAVINGRTVTAGQSITRDLVVSQIQDRGAWTPLSRTEGAGSSAHDVTIGNLRFHNAALIDEWEVVLTIREDFPSFKEYGLQYVQWTLTTHVAMYEDGQDAGLRAAAGGRMTQ